MSTQKQKFQLFQRLQDLGFTYDESVSLRRIEMTLQRWGEAECGDSNDHFSTGIERNETTGKPFRVIRPHHRNSSTRYPIADREAGALKRLNHIIAARNARAYVGGKCVNPVQAYHQTDCRGCNLYILRKSDLEAPENQIVAKAKSLGCEIAMNRTSTAEHALVVNYRIKESPEAFDCPEAAAIRFLNIKGETIPSRNYPIDSVYTRGLAVCC